MAVIIQKFKSAAGRTFQKVQWGGGEQGVHLGWEVSGQSRVRSRLMKQRWCSPARILPDSGFGFQRQWLWRTLEKKKTQWYCSLQMFPSCPAELWLETCVFLLLNRRISLNDCLGDNFITWSDNDLDLSTTLYSANFPLFLRVWPIMSQLTFLGTVS